MKHSENIENLAKALAKFQGEVGNPSLNSTVKVTMNSGGSYNFKYATFGEIKKIVKEPMANNGLSVVQLVGREGDVTTMLIHESGEWVSQVGNIGGFLKGLDKEGREVMRTTQEMGSLISYLKRYSFSAILGLVSEEDDDGNISDGNSYAYGKQRSSSYPKPTGEKKGTWNGAKSADYTKSSGASDKQMGLLEKLAEQNGFELASSYTSKEASDLISKYIGK